MPTTQPPTVLKTVLLTLAVWISTLLLFFFGIFVVALLFEDASTSAVGNAAMALIALEIVVALAAIGFVFVRSRRAFQPLMRAIWLVVYALVQLGSLAIAGFITLLALNR